MRLFPHAGDGEVSQAGKSVADCGQVYASFAGGATILRPNEEPEHAVGKDVAVASKTRAAVHGFVGGIQRLLAYPRPKGGEDARVDRRAHAVVWRWERFDGVQRVEKNGVHNGIRKVDTGGTITTIAGNNHRIRVVDKRFLGKDFRRKKPLSAFSLQNTVDSSPPQGLVNAS
jgi:hypothetical protein